MMINWSKPSFSQYEDVEDDHDAYEGVNMRL